MGSRVIETFRPAFCGVNSSIRGSTNTLGGFLALTTGTVTITDVEGNNLLAAVPVTAGIFTPMPFHFDTPGKVFTTASGASGYFAL